LIKIRGNHAAARRGTQELVDALIARQVRRRREQVRAVRDLQHAPAECLVKAQHALQISRRTRPKAEAIKHAAEPGSDLRQNLLGLSLHIAGLLGRGRDKIDADRPREATRPGWGRGASRSGGGFLGF